MGYYYSGYRRGRYWGSHQSSKRDRLTSLFGGIDHDIEKAFFALPSQELDALFQEYGKKHGKSAESYARKTYPGWKKRTVKLSGQTAERLLELLPPRLSKEHRFELIRKLRGHYIRRTKEYIDTPPESWREHVIPAVEKIIKASSNFKLPQELHAKAAWLTDGDSKAAQAILQSIEEEEARQRTSYLEAEFKRIEAFVTNVTNMNSISHTISLPQGEIHVTIEKEKQSFVKKLFGNGRPTMSNNNELVPREELQKALALQQSRGSLLNLTLDDLTENQKQELKMKIVEEKIGLDVSQAKADQRFYNSTRDMASTLQQVYNLEQSTKADYDINARYETASGSTQVTVKKNTNTMYIVVAVVVGIILFLLIRK